MKFFVQKLFFITGLSSISEHNNYCCYILLLKLHKVSLSIKIINF